MLEREVERSAHEDAGRPARGTRTPSRGRPARRRRCARGEPRPAAPAASCTPPTRGARRARAAQDRPGALRSLRRTAPRRRGARASPRSRPRRRREAPARGPRERRRPRPAPTGASTPALHPPPLRPSAARRASGSSVHADRAPARAPRIRVYDVTSAPAWRSRRAPCSAVRSASWKSACGGTHASETTSFAGTGGRAGTDGTSSTASSGLPCAASSTSRRLTTSYAPRSLAGAPCLVAHGRYRRPFARVSATYISR